MKYLILRNNDSTETTLVEAGKHDPEAVKDDSGASMSILYRFIAPSWDEAKVRYDRFIAAIPLLDNISGLRSYCDCLEECITDSEDVSDDEHNENVASLIGSLEAIVASMKRSLGG